MNHKVFLWIGQYPNYDIYTISCNDESILVNERNYFINIFGTDKIGDDIVIISPIINVDNTYKFMVTLKLKGIVNEYRKRIGNYMVDSYIDLVTR